MYAYALQQNSRATERIKSGFCPCLCNYTILAALCIDGINNKIAAVANSDNAK